MTRYHRAAAVCLMLAALAPAAAGAQPSQPPVPGGTRLDIVAEGSAVRVPDIAEISAGVVTQAITAAAAMTDNAGRMTAVLAAVRAAGVPDRDVATAALSLSPQYRYADNQPPVLTGYQASNQVTVRLHDIARAGRVIDTLVAQGANQINGPTLSVDHPEAALDEARTQAMVIARARAALYARAAGMSVRRIVSIGEGVADGPRPPMPMMAIARAGKDSADTPVEAGEQKLSVTLSVSFELD